MVLRQPITGLDQCEAEPSQPEPCKVLNLPLRGDAARTDYAPIFMENGVSSSRADLNYGKLSLGLCISADTAIIPIQVVRVSLVIVGTRHWRVEREHQRLTVFDFGAHVLAA